MRRSPPDVGRGLRRDAAGESRSVAGQQPAAAVFTSPDRRPRDGTVYAASCASCHMADLAGRNEAPQLAGNNFMNTWRNRSTKDLFEFIQSTMPPTGETLSAGAVPRGDRVHPAGERRAAWRARRWRRRPRLPIGSVATGAASTHGRGPPPPLVDGAAGGAASQAAPAGAGQAAGGGRGGAPANAGPLGVTVAGHGEELHAGHRRDAAQSGSGRLADGAAQLSGLEPQPAHADHAATTRRICSSCGAVGDERGPGQRAVAARPQRRRLPRQHP